MRPRWQWNTMRKCLERNPWLMEVPHFKGTGRDSYPNAFENLLVMAAKRNKLNPVRLNVDEWWCVDGVIQDLEGKPIFYYDAEYSNRSDLFDEDGKVKFWDIHIPIEKIDFFMKYQNSIYVRGNLEYVMVLRREPIVEAFNGEKIAWDFPTSYGPRDFIVVSTRSAISRGFLKTGKTVEWMKLVKQLLGLMYYWL